MAATASELPPKASNYASVAANLANTNRKVIEPQPPRHQKYIPHLHGPSRSKSLHTPRSRQQNSPVSIASSKAALLAHQGQVANTSKSTVTNANHVLETRAAATAARSSNTPHTARPRRPASSDGPNATKANQSLDNRAAAAATKSWSSTSAAAPAPSNAVYGERNEKASPAVSKAWSNQNVAAQRPVVAPLSDREAAMIQKRIEARQQESSERRERQPIIRIKPEFLGEHPPVRLEREEKAHAADLHEQAVNLAKQAYARQQQNQASSANMSKTAQQLANDKLARMNRSEADELDTMRSYYGTPAPVQRSKSQRLLKRSKSQQSRTSDRDDATQRERIRSQMNQLRSQIDQVDANKQEQDRKRLLEAARKKVQNDMLKMDESVYKDTGKMSKAMMDDWDSKARERTRGTRQQAAFQGLQPDRAVNIGGDRLIDRNEVDQLAASRVKPTLAEIDEAVQKKRDIDEQKREEKEEKQREKAKEKEEKAEQKREKAEEKRKLKEQKAAEKAEAGAENEKHSSLTEKLPALPTFGRHKRNESAQTADSVDHTEPTTDEDAADRPSSEADKKKSPLRLPAFKKFTRHRRNESVEDVSDDDVSSHEAPVENKRSSRILPIFGKFSRDKDQRDSTEIPRQEDASEEARPGSSSTASKSLKSRFSKLVHRNQAPESAETHQERSFSHTNGSVSTDLHEGDAASITDDEDLRPTISAPMPLEGSSPAEKRTSIDDREDALFGKHLPSKFHENM